MDSIENYIEKEFGTVIKVEPIQELWSGYGQIKRLWTDNSRVKSVIVKQISVPEKVAHPKGWNTPLSHQRKMQSYEVESYWYAHYANSSTARLPKFYKRLHQGNSHTIVMEDLDSEGLNLCLSNASIEEMRPCIEWLAKFHAKFLGTTPKGLWPVGSYWHLSTRPDELEKTEEIPTKLTASLIDKSLSKAKYQTIIHGDAKLANFCFSPDRLSVAAVDFQYVGGGCGMKDLAYFVSSCLTSDQCFELEERILSIYFEALKSSLDKQANFDELEREWRQLYPYAWADFYRFLKGWSPEHWKVHEYSRQMALKAQRSVLSELLETATGAAKLAGDIIQTSNKYKLFKKDAPSAASEVVTEIDYKAEKAILRALAECSNHYDFGIITEESQDDGTRFNKDYFWCVDPLDGTLAFTEGRPGHAVSIALVEKGGPPILGVVFDPVRNNLYHATVSGGSFKNGIPFLISKSPKSKVKLYADNSLKNEDNYEELRSTYEIHFGAGAVMNCISCIEDAPAKYIKFPKVSKGGGSIWDFAAASLIVNEAGGSATDYYGAPLDLNRKDSTYLNHRGVLISSV
ncbi:MAG: hypothetical protein CME64_07995 [Halobacteriovoraceae bacterium]|nr:hypothetical protein [Halobacteriovoraceae bacterium]|tara:strand:+ start:145302 stop:147017 length:1716 start_codon:yes stop_codon:yes gene_type:complete